jgi:glutamate-1-semialdehyde 2,1-aminomutase
MTMSAGLAVLKELEKGEVHRHINSLGSTLRRGFEGIASDCDEAVQVTGLGSLFMTHFSREPIQNMRDVVNANSKKLSEYHFGMLSKGIFIIPRHIGVISAAHTKEDIDRTLDASGEVMRAVSGTK